MSSHFRCIRLDLPYIRVSQFSIRAVWRGNETKPSSHWILGLLGRVLVFLQNRPRPRSIGPDFIGVVFAPGFTTSVFHILTVCLFNYQKTIRIILKCQARFTHRTDETASGHCIRQTHCFARHKCPSFQPASQSGRAHPSRLGQKKKRLKVLNPQPPSPSIQMVHVITLKSRW